MNCPYCQSQQTVVYDTRLFDEGAKIRRRRKCLACSRRFSTIELPVERMSAWREVGTNAIVGAVSMEPKGGTP